jgi:hypothetical protein
MRIIIVSFLLLVISPLAVYGEPAGETKAATGDLSLRIKSLSFIEDNEFYNPIVEGYTLLGFFFQPEIVYTASDKVILRAGGHILKYYGTEKFSQIRPIFSTTLNFSDKTALTLGTLSGPEKHHFLDPHFHDERLYNQYVEDGIQLTHVNDHFFNDTWISWENFIFKGDSTREQFTFGESFRYTSSALADLVRFEIPVQIQAKHKGGQISDYPEKTETFFNIAAGLRINFDLNSKKTVQTGIEYLRFLNKMRSDDSISGINHGYASWVRAFYYNRGFHLETGYWNAHDYYAPNGNPIYGSISTYKPDVVLHNRRLITGSASFRLLPASSVELFFAVDWFYDIDQAHSDQTYTLHLNFDKLISLTSKKRNRELYGINSAD